MRIAIGGMATESCTFSPCPTRLSDFRLFRGQDLLQRYPCLIQYPQVSFTPGVMARAMPGGPVERGAYDAIRSEFLSRLQEDGPWDGVYLELHGAMNVDGLDDAEGDWVRGVGEVGGPDCVIAASYDLHGNVSQRVVDNLDLLTAFRTAPHVDVEATHARAVALLVRALREGVRPHQAFVPIPVMLHGEWSSTEWEPGRSIYTEVAKAAAEPGVWDASLLVGYAWSDEPRAGACAVAVGTDREAVDQQAARLAQLYWDARRDFGYGVWAGAVEELLARALASPAAPVFISDSGDNPTAGGVGDVPYALERLIGSDARSAIFASMPDEAAVTVCYGAGVGAQVELALGGKLDPVHGTPLHVVGTVAALVPPDESEAHRQAVVRVGATNVIVTERRTAFHRIAQFRRLGLEPSKHKIVVVKVGYLVPELKAAAEEALLAVTPGAVRQDLQCLPYRRIRRPMYPLDADMQWQPAVV